MELREAGEAEEDVDDVCRELRVLLPVLSQHSGQGAHHRLCQHKQASRTTRYGDLYNCVNKT